MTICPIALAIHCVKCPLVSFCPGKRIVGDFDTYHSEEEKKKDETNTTAEKQQD